MRRGPATAVTAALVACGGGAQPFEPAAIDGSYLMGVDCDGACTVAFREDVAVLGNPVPGACRDGEMLLGFGLFHFSCVTMDAQAGTITMRTKLPSDLGGWLVPMTFAFDGRDFSGHGALMDSEGRRDEATVRLVRE